MAAGENAVWQLSIFSLLQQKPASYEKFHKN
jgi:hypothetical protein